MLRIGPKGNAKVRRFWKPKIAVQNGLSAADWIAEQLPTVVNGQPKFPKSPSPQESVDDPEDEEPSETTLRPKMASVNNAKPPKAEDDDQDQKLDESEALLIAPHLAESVRKCRHAWSSLRGAQMA